MVNEILIRKFIRKFFDNTNEYTILQFVWVITAYYFVLNSLLKSEIFKNLKINGIEKVLEINNKLLEYIENYNLLWITATIMLFISYLIITTVCKSIFENYKYLNTFCDYGWYLSCWSFLVYINYVLFIWTDKYYPLVLLILSIVVYYIKKVYTKRSMEKLI